MNVKSVVLLFAMWICASSVHSEVRSIFLGNETKLIDFAWAIESWPDIANSISVFSGCDLRQLKMDQIVSFETFENEQSTQGWNLAKYRLDAGNKFFAVSLQSDCFVEEKTAGPAWLIRHSRGTFSTVDMSLIQE